MKTKTNLKSTVTEKGRYVSQILHFINGEKRTFNNVDSHSIKQGQFTKFETKDGRLVMVNGMKYADKVKHRSLDHDFSSQKNALIEMCDGD